MNTIPVVQNTDRQLQRLAAQRQLYSTAKSIFGWQIFFGGPVAVALAFLSLICPELKVYPALWGILVVLSDLFWLTPWNKKLRNQAAQVQELFDCDVLALSWDELKTGKRPDPELINEQSKKYDKWASSMPSLSDWYDKRIASLPLHVARLICQRSNCWWDAKQRRLYAVWLAVGILIIFLSVLLLSVDKNFTTSDLIVKIIAPLAPLLLLGMRQYFEQTETIDRLNVLKDHAERIWGDALAGKPEAEITLRSRALQNEIFENRKRSPLVFDALFKRLRQEYEVQMNHGASEYILEAKEKLGLP